MSKKSIVGANAKRINDRVLFAAQEAIGRVELDLTADDLIALGLAPQQAALYHNAVRLLKIIGTQYTQNEANHVAELADRFDGIQEFDYATLAEEPCNISNADYEAIEAEVSTEVAELFCRSTVANILLRTRTAVSSATTEPFAHTQISQVLGSALSAFAELTPTDTGEYDTLRNSYASLSNIAQTLFDKHIADCKAFSKGLEVFNGMSNYVAVLSEEHKRSVLTNHVRDMGRVAAVAILELARIAPDSVDSAVAHGLIEQREAIDFSDGMSNDDKVIVLRNRTNSANSHYNIYK